VLDPEYGSVPEATVVFEVESVAGAPQAKPPGPGLKPAVQVMVTAETGTVGQLEKLVPTVYTSSFQGSLAVVAPVFQETVTEVFPASVGESGSRAEKETEPGGGTVKFAVASGFGPDRAGRGARAFTAGFPVCAANNATIHSDSSMGFRQTRLRPREW
jgi:hypothetical protein